MSKRSQKRQKDRGRPSSRRRDGDVRFSYYLVAFLDLLGQSNAFQHIAALPVTPEAERDFRAAAVQILSSVDHIRTSLSSTFSRRYSLGSNLPRPLTPEEKQVLRELDAVPPSVYPFSDSVLVHSRIKNDSGHLSMFGVSLLLSSFTGIMSLAFERGIAVRGGIDVGVGCELETGEVYGPALLSAYQLESAAAAWPRIVVGQELLNLVRQISVGQPTTLHERVNAVIASSALAWTFHDHDGLYAVDYLGPQAYRVFGAPKYRELLGGATEGVARLLTQWSHDPKVTSKYVEVRDYISAAAARVSG